MDRDVSGPFRAQAFGERVRPVIELSHGGSVHLSADVAPSSSERTEGQ